MALPLAYSKSLANWHWLTATSMIAAVGCVMKAQTLGDKDPQKGTWMFRHKSFGLLTAFFVVPRVAARYSSLIPAPMPGSPLIQNAARASHGLLYVFMIGMSVTGVLMGIFSGRGMPFFVTTIPGAEANKKISGTSYNIHKTLGHYGKYLIPLHVAGAGYHVAKGQTIFARMNPFAP